jgi:hypothetical protein
MSKLLLNLVELHSPLLAAKTSDLKSSWHKPSNDSQGSGADEEP